MALYESVQIKKTRTKKFPKCGRLSWPAIWSTFERAIR